MTGKTIYIVAVWVATPLLGGCIASLGEGMALGAGEAMAAEAAAGGAAEAAFAEGFAARGASGLLLRAGAEGFEVAASEEALLGGTLRANLEELAGQRGLRLIRDPSGVVKVDGGRLGFTAEGRMTLSERGGAARVVGEISDRKIWEVDETGRRVRPTGVIRARPTGADVRFRAGPTDDSQILGVLRPGSTIDVIRLHAGWFEIIAEGEHGWVYAPYLQIIPIPLALGTAFVGRDSSSAEGSANRVVLDVFDYGRRHSGVAFLMSREGLENATRYCSGDAQNCLDNNYSGRRPVGGRTDGARVAQTTWADSSLSVVILETMWEVGGSAKSLCQTFDLDREDERWKVRFFDVPHTCTIRSTARASTRTMATASAATALRVSPSYDAAVLGQLRRGDSVLVLDSIAYGAAIPRSAIVMRPTTIKSLSGTSSLDAGSLVIVIGTTDAGLMVSAGTGESERLGILPPSASLDQRPFTSEMWARVTVPGRPSGFIPTRFLSVSSRR